MTLDEIFIQTALLSINFSLERRHYHDHWHCHLSKEEGGIVISLSMIGDTAEEVVQKAWSKYQLTVYGGSAAHQGLAITHEPPKPPNTVTFDDEIPF